MDPKWFQNGSKLTFYNTGLLRFYYCFFSRDRQDCPKTQKRGAFALCSACVSQAELDAAVSLPAGTPALQRVLGQSPASPDSNIEQRIPKVKVKSWLSASCLLRQSLLLAPLKCSKITP